MTHAVDVLVIGDGPAGSALALACQQRGVDVLLVGGDESWDATYGGWLDELQSIAALVDPADIVGETIRPVAWTTQRHALDRGYTVLDNDALRRGLRSGVAHLAGRVDDVVIGVERHVAHMTDGSAITSRLVVDATGWPAAFAGATVAGAPPAWQTAFGIVLPEPPDGDLGTPTLMDFRAPPRTPTSAPRGVRHAPTFAYSLPVADGWLVEETVLAARPAVEPVALIPQLAARLGLTADAMLDRAVRTEYVRIPMGGPRPRRDQAVVGFGAAAGYVNPTTGYSVVHALKMATPVAASMATALADATSASVAASTPVWNAVWPVAHRRTRTLHDYGLDMMMRMDGAALRNFFGAFFELPADVWPAYLRPDTPPGELSRVMTQLFRAAPWSTRRRLVRGNPMAFARLPRPR